MVRSSRPISVLKTVDFWNVLWSDFWTESSGTIVRSSRPICTVENIVLRIVLGVVQDDQFWSDRPGTMWRSAGPIPLMI
ncbi:hypothetical protein MA16_Dca024495 [Dendrobium catenatum]|uniref:Uncharacterized protein n=1 Tax=Dendrobium catenatum TaxID=906689 RepID=A0A2I0V6P0_9ASPA|nr:hypothetical protein MA16_Dca028283 [Dendrobium catenatum]PKU60265.1 hypothetical protein MA16_Dca024495 [Dendrobium catenatum]